MESPRALLPKSGTERLSQLQASMALRYCGFWMIALLLFMGTGSAAQRNAKSSRPTATGQRLYHQGLEAARKHDLATAIRKFRWALEYLPKSPEVHYSLGSAYLQHGDINPAAVEFRKAIALKPDFTEAYFKMAVALESRNDIDGAITFYNYAIHQRPQWAAAHDALGLLLAQRGDLAGARSEFETAIKIKPDLADAHLHLGTILWRQHHYSQALGELQKAVALNPSSVEARYYLEIAERQQEHTTGTSGQSQGATLNKPEANPLIATNATNQGEKDFLDGNLDAAIQEFQSAIQESPDYARAHYGLAWTLRAEGNLTEARAQFSKARQLDPSLQEPTD
jgi:Tfp pilus assembly protein PilF